MKYKLTVDISFVDKYTGQLYKVGDIITVDKKRYDELIADKRELVHFVERIKG